MGRRLRKNAFVIFKELQEKEDDYVHYHVSPYGPKKKKSIGSHRKTSSGGYVSFRGKGWRNGSSYESKQFCYFHMRYKRNKALNKKHFDYIQRAGKGRGGGDPVLYGEVARPLIDIGFHFSLCLGLIILPTGGKGAGACPSDPYRVLGL
jgi:hypothetical protein